MKAKGVHNYFEILYSKLCSEITQSKYVIYRYFRLLIEDYNTKYGSK